MRKTLTFALLVSALASGAGMGAIIVPSYLASASSPDSISSKGTPTNLVNGSGLSAPVVTGDTLAYALSVTHVYDGKWKKSWVTIDHVPDYFAGASANPTIVFDLGEDRSISDLVIWQYQNQGGGGANGTQNIDVRFNTAAEGTTTFSGTAQTLTVARATGNAQGFTVTGTPTARYIQFEVTDNYYDGNVGGDRVGLGEVRVNVVPEASVVSLLGSLSLLGGLLRRRR